MESVKEKLIDELKLLRYRLIYEMSSVEFNMKVRGENNYSIDNVFELYNRMLHDLKALIDKFC